jgi:N-acetylglucosamine kinase-like BadF-type ATPase
VESVIGIDAGGSRIRAIAVRGHAVVDRGSGGPGNPHTVSARDRVAHYSTALDGFPAARSVALCAAGAGSRVGRERLRRALAPTLPGAQLVVLPDYAAAWSAAPAGTEIVVIAGTGSVIASRDPDAGYVVTGGAGLAGGDPGSAVRLGRAALAHVGLGAGGRPAVAVARHAAHLTSAAESGEPWAVDALRAEIATFASDVRLHAARIGRGHSRSTVAATGGVFRSPAAATALTDALGPSFDVVRMPIEPVMGAVRIARELAA